MHSSDDLGAGYGSLNLLQQLRPDIVKLDRALIEGIDADASKQAIVGNLLRMAREPTREMGIATVGEGIETRAEWDWVRERGIDYVQGYFFARPGNPPLRPSPDLGLDPAPG